MSEWIKPKERLPNDYVSVVVLHNGERKIMSHEDGWWYGLSKNDSPTAWLEDENLNCAIAKSEGLKIRNQVIRNI